MKKINLIKNIKSFISLLIIMTFISGSATGATWYVKLSGNGSGTSWANATWDLQSAISNASTGDQVWVEKGVYIPYLDLNGVPTTSRNACFTMKNGVAIYGGFYGNETALADRNYKVYLTILSGNIGARNNTDNCYHVVFNNSDMNNTAILDGFTITEGNANGGGASSYAGGIYNYNSDPTIQNCIISYNNAGYGAGMMNRGSNSSIINCIFNNNTSTGDGAGMHNYSNSTPSITNCVFYNNNCVYGKGGGMHNSITETFYITNCSFYGNTSNYGGKGIDNYLSSPYISNCILWDNSINEIVNASTCNTIVSYSIVNGGYAGTANSSSNPLFLNTSDLDGVDNIIMTNDDGLSTQTSSPAVDAGLNSAVPTGITTDITGENRIYNSIVNMGAYETIGCLNRTYITLNGAGNMNGTSWSNALPGNKIQDAINDACEFGEIWIAAGTYYPTQDINDNKTPANNKTKTYRMRNKLSIYGGFLGSELYATQRSLYSNKTILSGDLGTIGNSSDNAYNLFYNIQLDLTASLDGVFVRDGNAIGPYQGAAMYNLESHVTLKNCTFENNTSEWRGGAIYNEESSPKIANCVFYNNHTDDQGGAIANWINCSLVITNCMFTKNTSASSGSAILNNESDIIVTNSLFHANAVNEEDPENPEGSGDGAIYNLTSSPIFTNCTFTQNVGVYANVGGIISFGPTSCNIVINNCLFWDNGFDFDKVYSSGNSFIVSHSMHNISYNPGLSYVSPSDPLFIDPTSIYGADNVPFTSDDGFNIPSNSPCYNVGDNNLIPAGILTDITAVHNRILNNIVELGAYEFYTKEFEPRMASPQTTSKGFENADFAIENYPNPYDSYTTISFILPEDAKVTISIFDISGRKMTTLSNDYYTTGEHKIRWNSDRFAPGYYTCKMQIVTTDGQSLTKNIKMVKTTK